MAGGRHRRMGVSPLASHFNPCSIYFSDSYISLKRQTDRDSQTDRQQVIGNVDVEIGGLNYDEEARIKDRAGVVFEQSQLKASFKFNSAFFGR